VRKCASSYNLLSRHLGQVGNKYPESPCWHIVDQLHDYRKVAEDVGEEKIPISRSHAPVLLVEEMKTVAKSVRGDYVARVRFKDGVHAQDLTILSGRFIPSREHLFQILFNNGLDSTDAGIEEEAIDAVSAHTVHFVLYCGNDGVRG